MVTWKNRSHAKECFKVFLKPLVNKPRHQEVSPIVWFRQYPFFFGTSKGFEAFLWILSSGDVRKQKPLLYSNGNMADIDWVKLRDWVRTQSNTISASYVWRRTLSPLYCSRVLQDIRSCDNSGSKKINYLQFDIFANVCLSNHQWISLRHLADEEIVNLRPFGE